MVCYLQLMDGGSDKRKRFFQGAEPQKAGPARNVTLELKEFVHRFLLHILPRWFVKTRYYGIQAAHNKKTKLVLCQRLSKSKVYPPKYAGLSKIAIVSLLAGMDLDLCPFCRVGKMVIKETLLPGVGMVDA